MSFDGADYDNEDGIIMPMNMMVMMIIRMNASCTWVLGLPSSSSDSPREGEPQRMSRVGGWRSKILMLLHHDLECFI